MSIKVGSKPNSICFTKKDLTPAKNFYSYLPQIDQKSYYYNMYIHAGDTWDQQQANSPKAQPAHFNLSNRSTQTTIHNEPQQTSSQTITHSAFHAQNSKKAIFRMKIHKSLRKANKIRQNHQFQSIMDDLSINQKMIAAWQQRGAFKVQQASLVENKTNKFYLNKKRRVGGSLAEQVSLEYNINQITPW